VSSSKNQYDSFDNNPLGRTALAFERGGQLFPKDGDRVVVDRTLLATLKDKRDFMLQYVLNRSGAMSGIGLDGEGAATEAEKAWNAIVRATTP
jgi:hypothetical protein